MRFLILSMALLMPLIAMSQRKLLNSNEDQIYFWFNIRIFNSVNHITKVDAFTLRLQSTNISHGNLKEFQKALWTGTANGSKIAIGPFPTFEQASSSLQYYKNHKDTTIGNTDAGLYHWYLINVNIMARSHSYQFERMAARVASGSAKEFCAVLRESLDFKKLAIGPFVDELEAEQSKQLYRIEE